MNTETLESYADKIPSIALIKSAIAILVCYLLYKLSVYLLIKGGGSIFRSKKSKSYIKMTKNILRYLFVAFAVMLILQTNGINVNSILAGIGIAGIIIGFAVQDILKDMIKGIDIIADDYFHVGDVISYGNVCGKVISIGLRNTKILELKTMNTVSVSNRIIEQVSVISKQLDIVVPMPYEVPVETAEKAVHDILSRISKLEDTESCEYKGVDELAESSIKYRLRIFSNPENHLQLRRDALRCVLLGLADNNISVPYNQIDVHTVLKEH